MPQVNPSILIWARQTAGLTRAEAARKIQLGAARGVEPGERLAALETGAEQPTRSMLARMAKSYRRPLTAFYLAEPPRASRVGTDFRTLSGETSAREDALVRALVREAITRQGIVRDQLDDDDGEEAAFVGTIAMTDGPTRALQALRRIAGAGPASAVPRPFDELRDAVERAGAYVLLQGDLGSHHTALETTAFRGFALADRRAPFIVVNSNDARAAWSFTLLHEVVHLLLGHTGISGAEAESDIEKFCNDVASECLLPTSAVEAFEVYGLGDDQLTAGIGRFANEWRASRSLVAYRLHRAGKIDGVRYRQIADALRRQWREERKRRDSSKGAPNPYVVKRHRVGKALLGLVKRRLRERELSTTKAAVALGVKPTQVGLLLGLPAEG